MAVAGFLDRVGGEHPYGVDGARVELGPAVGGDGDIGHDRAVPSEGANLLTRTPRAYRWATAADMGTVRLRSCTGECQSMMRALDFPIGAPVEGALDLPADVWGVSGACDEHRRVRPDSDGRRPAGHICDRHRSPRSRARLAAAKRRGGRLHWLDKTPDYRAAPGHHRAGHVPRGSRRTRPDRGFLHLDRWMPGRRQCERLQLCARS